jgi:hypothetical protein
MEEIRRTVEQRYDWVDNFSEGRAIVQLNGKYGVVDLEGNEVVPLLYDWVNNFSEGRARVKLDGRRGVVDLDGNVVLPCWYKNIERLTDGFKTMHQVSTHDGEHLYFDRDGNPIAEPVN